MPSTEVEFSLRAYGKNFDNPHARAPADPDTTQGSRQRIERGRV
ncbi:MAG: hypothetical protein R3C68_00295 [Myxococcota bacterium]